MLITVATIIASIGVLTWLLTAVGLADESMLTADRPLTDFIWRPDALSWVVALLAGIAGMMSLTSNNVCPLVGVLISVTTVPAAANAAVALAYGVLHEAVGSGTQLLINVSAIVIGGVLTVLVERLWSARVTSRRSVDGDGNPRPPLIRQAARPTPVTKRP